MASPFSYFVIFAEMRTGSNFLEENVNDYPGLCGHGELFNPHFIGSAGKTELWDITLAEREADPLGFLDVLRREGGEVPGFRYFHDHDPRVLPHLLEDSSCAKVVLTRNPLESYVSLKIAGATGQWRLGDGRHAKSAKVRFDPDEFETYLADRQAFQLRLQRALQTSGQTAFYISYEDIQDVAVLNGLARFLGVDAPKEALNERTKKQNPGGLEDKLLNSDELGEALSRIDFFDLGRTPNFEPRRGPAVPGYMAGVEVPLLFMPIKGAPQDTVAAWLAGLDGAEPEALTTGFTQKTLRQWKRRHAGHRSFTVLRHPVARAHAAFCRHVLPAQEGSWGELRDSLRRHYKVPLPEDDPGDDWSVEAHRAAFLGFLEFLRRNLGGQTSLRVDPAWASLGETLQGFAQFGVPDMVLREDALEIGLAQLAAQVGRAVVPACAPAPDDTPFALVHVYTDEIEAAARAAYQRDYMMFGFGPWVGAAD